MKAYAVLDGGGVKGPALAGCLAAAEEAQIEFVGYAGTSVGSLIALMAALGYNANEMKDIVCEEVPFASLLDDGGDRLKRWEAAFSKLADCGSVSGKFALVSELFAMRGEILNMTRGFGIYDGHKLENKTRELIGRKFARFKDKEVIKFDDLYAAGAKPMRFVAAHLADKRATVFGEPGKTEVSNVLTAVKASCSYPFVFKPVMLDRSAIADGGLASNLPVWVFDRERDRNGLPLVAFDLVSQPVNLDAGKVPTLGDYMTSLTETALESSDALLRGGSNRLMRIEIPIPGDIKTLDLDLSRERRIELFDKGRVETLSYFTRKFGQFRSNKTDAATQIRAAYGNEEVVFTALEGLVNSLNSQFASGCARRAHVALRDGNVNELQIAYTQGMDEHPDIDLRLPDGEHPMASAMRSAKPIVGNWDVIREDPKAFGLDKALLNKIPSTKFRFVSLPIFDLRKVQLSGENELAGLNVVGVLSVDTEEEDAVFGDGFQSALPILKAWADVIGKILN